GGEAVGVAGPATLIPGGTHDVDVLHQRVQQLVCAGVDAEKRNLIRVRVLEPDQADVIALIDRGDTGQRAAGVPVEREMIGQDEIEHATLHSNEDWPVGGRAFDLAGRIGQLKLHAARVEVAYGLGPNL